MPSHAELAVRILVAMALGGAIGLERELADKNAGFRTHISVTLGSCLFAILSAYSFDYFGSMARNDSSYQVDVSRIASQVAVGIGFLGGGAILKHGATVRGLTTAASLWVTAAIGLAVGFGQFFVAMVTTAALLVALIGLRPPARWLESRVTRAHEQVAVMVATGADPGAVIDALRALNGVRVESLTVRQHEGQLVVHADVRNTIAGRDIEAALHPLLADPGVAGVEFG